MASKVFKYLAKSNLLIRSRSLLTSRSGAHNSCHGFGFYCGYNQTMVEANIELMRSMLPYTSSAMLACGLVGWQPPMAWWHAWYGLWQWVWQVVKEKISAKTLEVYPTFLQAPPHVGLGSPPPFATLLILLLFRSLSDISSNIFHYLFLNLHYPYTHLTYPT